MIRSRDISGDRQLRIDAGRKKRCQYAHAPNRLQRNTATLNVLGPEDIPGVPPFSIISITLRDTFVWYAGTIT